MGFETKSSPRRLRAPFVGVSEYEFGFAIGRLGVFGDIRESFCRRGKGLISRSLTAAERMAEMSSVELSSSVSSSFLLLSVVEYEVIATVS